MREAYTKKILTWELDTNPENEQIHHIMTDQLLELLDRERCAYVSANGNDVTKEPEKSYIPNLREPTGTNKDQETGDILAADGPATAATPRKGKRHSSRMI